MKIYDGIGCAAPDMLFPKAGTDLSRWAVIACDQYTSEPDYWKKVEETAGDAPSALRLVLPEVYLGSEGEESRLAGIASNIKTYLEDGTLAKLPEGFMLVDRKTPVHASRKGLVMAIDLEQYDYEPGNKAMCRATEGTVLSRIPPRIKIRANAQVELPHIMILIDDPEDTVIGAAFDKAAKAGIKPLYDTPLMMGSGSITGTLIESSNEIADGIVSALETLKANSSDGLLYLVGDGNHSLASAKAHWENVRKDLSGDDLKTHPARYALAEIVNIHDAGLEFEPIHRVVFGITPDEFIEGAKFYFEENGITAGDAPVEGQQNFVVTASDKDTYISLANPPHSLAVGSVQQYIDSLVEDNEGVSVDYIHGEDSVRSLAGTENTGVLLPAISRSAFFDEVRTAGVYPRKTFSMGEAFEKRFYMEARKITK
ncbi:MAG: DUF1015 domain-containing protein [Saccharofermentans sp.]|nr:DUF1015 domain-containing protein [Saccharofermentans sp.]